MTLTTWKDLTWPNSADDEGGSWPDREARYSAFVKPEARPLSKSLRNAVKDRSRNVAIA